MLNQMRSCCLRRLVVQSIVCVALSQGVSMAETPSLNAIISRLEQLQNVMASFEQETTTDFDPAVAADMPEDVRANFQARVHERADGTFRFCRGWANAEMLTDVTGTSTNAKAPLQQRRELIAINPERAEYLVQEPGARKVNGRIDATMDFPEPWTVDVGFGLRLLREPTWLNADDIRRAKVVSESDTATQLELAGSNGARHVIEFDKQHGYALLIYRVVYAEKDSYEEVKCSDFHQIGGTYVPYQIVRTNTVRDSAGHLRQPFTRAVHIHDVALADPKNDHERLMVQWPPHSKVVDTRTGQALTVGENPQVLTDKIIAAELAKKAQQQKELEQKTRKRLDQLSDPNGQSKPESNPMR